MSRISAKQQSVIIILLVLTLTQLGRGTIEMIRLLEFVQKNQEDDMELHTFLQKAAAVENQYSD